MDQSQQATEAFEEGNRLAQKGDLAGAEEAYRRADEGGHGAGAAFAGLFLESRGELGEAEAAFRRADERGDGFGAFRLGLLLSRAGEWDEAREAWGRAEGREQQRPPFDHMALLGAGAPGGGEAAPQEVQRSALANPVLIGAVTVLVLIVGVFLAYNANTGLPFVPTRQLRIDFVNGAALTNGSQVTSTGGYRIGLVSDLRAVRLPSGLVGAEVTLKLDRSFGAVPVNSTAAISPRNLFGQKYVDLERGTSSQVLPDGGLLPASRTTIPVQFDDINKMFNPGPARRCSRTWLGLGIR